MTVAILLFSLMFQWNIPNEERCNDDAFKVIPMQLMNRKLPCQTQSTHVHSDWFSKYELEQWDLHFIAVDWITPAKWQWYYEKRSVRFASYPQSMKAGYQDSYWDQRGRPLQRLAICQHKPTLKPYSPIFILWWNTPVQYITSLAKLAKNKMQQFEIAKVKVVYL